MTDYNQIQTISRQLELLESRIKALETSGRLFASGIGAGGITVYKQGSIRVEGGGAAVNIYDGGNFEVYGTASDPGEVSVGSGGVVSASGPVTFKGKSSFGGNVSITGDLTVKGKIVLKDGIIKANALKNQMSSARDTESNSGFGVDGTYRDKASTTVTIPAWANKAFVYIAGSVHVRITSGDRRTYSRARIEDSYSQPAGISAVGGTDSDIGGSLGFSAVVSNSGDKAKNITAGIQIGGGVNIGSNGSNSASAAMYAIFYR